MFCPNCGAQLVSQGAGSIGTPPKRASSRWWPWALVVGTLTAALGAAAALLLLTGGGGTKNHGAKLPAPADLPPNVVALIANVPPAEGTITRHDFAHAIELAAAQAGEKNPPKPGDPKYDELRESALNSIFEAVWLQGLASEEGVEVTRKEIEAELKKLKKQNFKSQAEFTKFLKELHYSPTDVTERVKLQILSKRIQAKIAASVPPGPSRGEIAAYYAQRKLVQFMQNASRDVRTIVNADEAQVEQAKALLETNDLPSNWKRVARRYSTDSTTNADGGLQVGVTPKGIEEVLGTAFFSAPLNRIEGPIMNGAQGYVIFEVVRATPGKVQPLSQVKSQIESELSREAQETAFSKFAISYEKRWRARTVCAPGFVVEKCSNGKNKPVTPADAIPISP